MKAKKKKIDEMTLADLGIDASGPGVTLEKLEPVPERTGAKMIEGSVDEQVTELIRILKQDEKVL
jgi:electron transfer flavoprotein beta subunit